MDLKKKRVFEVIFPLSQKHPWLNDKVENLTALLFEECDTDIKRALLISLLHDFTYLSNETFMSHVVRLAKLMTQMPGLTDSNTQIVAMSSDSFADSAQQVLYALKPIFEYLGWRKHLLINAHGKSLKEFQRKNNEHKNLILIDEFIGTGNTAKNQVTTLRRVYADKGINDINISVFGVAGTSAGLELLKSHNINVTVAVELGKGISDKYEGEDREEKLKLMIALESILSDSYAGRDMPQLGYGKSEALYAREYGNTPNNVFPIFWWRFLKDNTERKTLLTRAMGDA